MEQLNLIKRTLNMPTVYESYNHYWGKLGGFEIISLSLLASLFLRVITSSVAPLYLINGLLVPLFFLHRGQGINLTDYWPCLAGLLLFRQIVSFGGVLDPFILIALWHPNIAWSAYLAKRFGHYLNPTKTTHAQN